MEYTKAQLLAVATHLRLGSLSHLTKQQVLERILEVVRPAARAVPVSRAGGVSLRDVPMDVVRYVIAPFLDSPCKDVNCAGTVSRINRQTGERRVCFAECLRDLIRSIPREVAVLIRHRPMVRGKFNKVEMQFTDADHFVQLNSNPAATGWKVARGGVADLHQVNNMETALAEVDEYMQTSVRKTLWGKNLPLSTARILVWYEFKKPILLGPVDNPPPFNTSFAGEKWSSFLSGRPRTLFAFKIVTAPRA